MSEIIKGRVTLTATGYPASFKEAKAVGAVAPATEDGWFWIAATPRSAARLRRHGNKAVGSLTTTWIPPQRFEFALEDVPEPEGEYRVMFNDADEMIGVIPPVAACLALVFVPPRARPS